MPVDSELLATLLAPIVGENSAGRDLRYDPAYAVFKEERREDIVIPGSDDTDRKVADWNRVISLGTDLLGRQTKDLQLAAWMTEALLRRDGIGGLATGLEVLRGLLERFWESLHPEMEGGDPELRIGPLEWVGSRLVYGVQLVTVASGGITFLDYIQSRAIPPEGTIADASYDDGTALRAARDEAASFGKVMPETVDSAVGGTSKTFFRALVTDVLGALASLDNLERVSDERFGREAPAFTGLREALDELRRFTAGTLARKLEDDPDPVDNASEDVGDAHTAVVVDGSLSSEPVSLQDASQRIALVARWFRKQNASNPAPYAMLRGLRWGELQQSAPELDPRLLEAPPTAVRSRLKALMLDGKWPELLEQAENLMATPSGRGWLDLQRYVLTACSNLGDGYDAVAAVVRSELRVLLAAAPMLPRMTLMDDTPTANEETREWLRTDIFSDDASGHAASNTADITSMMESDADASTVGGEILTAALDDEQSTSRQGGFSRPRRSRTQRIRDPFEMARSEVALGRSGRAIELLTEELARESSPRGRFVRQTQIAFVMVEAGLLPVAQPLLRKLVETIDERSLEQWESGPLIAQPMALLYRVLVRTDADESERMQFYLRIARLDPLQAMALPTP